MACRAAVFNVLMRYSGIRKVAAGGSVVEVAAVIHVRIDAFCVGQPFRVVDAHVCSRVVDCYSNIEGRGVSHVVTIGLEGRAEHGDDLAPQISSEGLAGEVKCVFAPAQVDLIHLAQERQGFLRSELTSLSRPRSGRSERWASIFFEEVG